MRHVWTAPALQGDFFALTLRSGAVMCPACLRGTLTAGHDVIRETAPDQIYDLGGHDVRWVLPFLGLTGRHHAFIALAILYLFGSAAAYAPAGSLYSVP